MADHGWRPIESAIIEGVTREQLMEQALCRLTAAPPSTKGMDPKSRAQCLYASMEQRIAIAKDALRRPLPPPPGSDGDG